MNKGIWTSDWLVALAIVVGFLIAAWLGSFQGLERIAYDLGVKASSGAPSDRIAVISIDDESVENIGRWPWPRDIHAELIDILKRGDAKVIGNTVFYAEPQQDPGLIFIDEALQTLDKSSLAKLTGEISRLDTMARTGANGATSAARQFIGAYTESPLRTRVPNDVKQLRQQLAEARDLLNTDLRLAQSLADSGNVLLAMALLIGNPQGNPDQDLPDYVLENALVDIVDNTGATASGLLPLPTFQTISPIPQIGNVGAGIGNVTVLPDVDGAVRTEPLVLRYYDVYFPSMSLLLAARSLNLTVNDITVLLGEGVQVGNLKINTDPNLQMNTFYYADQATGPAFQVDSFFDVLTGKIPPEKYRDKIVLIGASATGLGSLQVTPISTAMPPVLSLAHSVSSILNEDFYIQPSWGLWVEIVVVLLVALYLIALLPSLKASMAAGATLGIAVLLVICHLYLMAGQSLWLRFMLPLSLLVIGHLLLTTKRFLVTERGKLRSDAESAESNRMLGLSLQGQGQLDAAFDKFRKLPVDDSVMDLLYNLALDLERKRQFNKAHAVYQHMSDHDPKYRDLDKRMARAERVGETMIMGGAGGVAAGTMMLDAGEGVEKPMLGRYEVEKELGKGAMGVVYLGKDPKISRVVAIKTMALAQEFDEDEIDDVKARFFREAETAGRLSHPNIVTIFDAGEEHDLAYIAMEFLKGSDLTNHTKAGELLPADKVLELMAQCAEALHYAHTQNVVHRDIKPANIMYHSETEELKITDFGIARITDSSKTKTGVVLGTPSYMSPEQLAGKKVDGRSDLFSLGVMVYQLVTGQLPFQADSMATLMYKITNEEQPPISKLRPDMKPCLGQIINKALRKDSDKRYQNGVQMAKDLRICKKMITTS